MKRILNIILAAALLCGLAQTTFAADEANPAGELTKLKRKIESKLQQGKDKESDFTDDLKAFDTFIAENKTKNPESAANAAYLKALLYIQVFSDTDKATEILKGVKKEFATTKVGGQVDQVLASLERQAAAKKVAENMKVGSKFPEFAEKDINGKSFSLADYKGKVVLIDFWATWCGPCRAELPNVLETYNKYHSKGFEIIGISLDEDKTKLTDFTKAKDMKWQQYFDGKGWENKLAQQFGVQSIPATFLVNGEGVIIAKDLRGDDLGDAVQKALAKK
jgi:peroxiredoxin